MKNCKAMLKTASKILGATLLLITSVVSNAQQSHPEYAAVKQVIDDFFESINTGNSALLAGLEVEGAQIFNIREETAGEYEFVTRNWFGEENFSADRV